MYLRNRDRIGRQLGSRKSYRGRKEIPIDIELQLEIIGKVIGPIYVILRAPIATPASVVWELIHLLFVNAQQSFATASDGANHPKNCRVNLLSWFQFLFLSTFIIRVCFGRNIPLFSALAWREASLRLLASL